MHSILRMRSCEHDFSVSDFAKHDGGGSLVFADVNRNICYEIR